MDAALATATTDAALAADAWRARLAPPRMEVAPFTRAELDAWFRGGEVAVDDCERLLAWAARAAGALDVAIGEGLHALRQGDRLAQLACHLDDYAREVLDIGKRTAENLARLGGALRTRPLLREALRSGRVRIRAAETVLPVACGEAEALWVERAASETVRQLEEEVRRARACPGDEEEDWLLLRTHLPRQERAVLDAGLDLAGELMGERERQMRARRKIAVPLPRRMAMLLAAAIHTVRERLGGALAPGTCLAVIAAHFVETWNHLARGSLTCSRKVRDRDEGFCRVPGCSHRAVHSHHVLFRSHGGSDEAENQIALCAFHHLRCIHGGHLAVFGRAPDGLTWLLGGEEWTGPDSATRPHQ